MFFGQVSWKSYFNNTCNSDSVLLPMQVLDDHVSWKYGIIQAVSRCIKTCGQVRRYSVITWKLVCHCQLMSDPTTVIQAFLVLG
jgi:hypothetical protein